MYQVTYLMIEVLTFTAVALLSVTAIQGFVGVNAVRRRLAAQQAVVGSTSQPVLKDQKVRSAVLKWVESSTSLSDFKDQTKLRRDLALAGFDHPAFAIWYVIVRFSAAIGLPILLMLSQVLVDRPMNTTSLTAATLLLCATGLVGPRLFINHRIAARKEQMADEFPDALDLLIVCVEAGLGLEAAFVRVGLEVVHSHPRTSLEFARLTQEMNAGRSREDALRALADRVDVDMVRSFVALMIQTDTLGGSIGQSLRTYSAEMRETRLLRAEEKALRIPVLMTIPLVVCILPVIIAALLLPPIIDVMRTLLPALRGAH